MTNFEWLNTITPIQSREWHNDRVILPCDIENFEFYERSTSYLAKVNPKQIKGIEYAYNYNHSNDIDWLELLNSLIRFNRVRSNMKSTNDLVNHVHFKYDEDKVLAKYGNVYITTQGQHRMALAKFLEIPEVEVYIIEYAFNQKKYELYQNRICQNTELINLQFLYQEDRIAPDNYNNNFTTLTINGKKHCIDNELVDDFINHYKKLSPLKYYTLLKEYLLAQFEIEIPANSDLNLRLHKINSVAK